MLNHSPDVQEQCHRLIKESGNLFVIASRDYKAGDQVFINYHYLPGRPDLSKLPNHHRHQAGKLAPTGTCGKGGTR